MKIDSTIYPLVGLAPMEGVTEFPTRLWFSLHGKFNTMGTPFLRVTDSYPGNSIPNRWAPEITIPDLDKKVPYQLIPQIMGVNQKRLIQTGEQVLQLSNLVELNCGCPSPTVFGKGAGSGLLAEPKIFEQLISCMSQNLGSEHFMVKTRLGIKSKEEFKSILDSFSRCHLNRLTLHGRTREQKYTGQADWDLISKAASALPYPVWASGDILSLKQLKKLSHKYPLINGILIGRGALRDPWILMAKSSVSAKELATSLKIYGYLNLLFRCNFEELIKTVDDGWFVFEHQNTKEQMSALVEHLEAKLNLTELDPMIERQALGRMKLLYNYLRSSLPIDFFKPPVLRAKSFSQFFANLKEISSNKGGNPMLPLSVQTQHNWIYAGEPRPDRSNL